MPDDTSKMTKEEICVEIVDILKNHFHHKEATAVKLFVIEDYDPDTECVIVSYWNKGMLDYETIQKQKGVLKQFGKPYKDNLPNYIIPSFDGTDYLSIDVDANGKPYPKDERPFHEKLLIVLRKIVNDGKGM